jgi:ABC-type transport system involved in cytochrome bd biosynthesis fused ATPase/permease subunit
VTHNLETIQLADRVLFLENGRLAADGTHAALYREHARYRALWEEGSRARGRVPAGRDGAGAQTERQPSGA